MDKELASCCQPPSVVAKTDRGWGGATSGLFRVAVWINSDIMGRGYIGAMWESLCVCVFLAKPPSLNRNPAKVPRGLEYPPKIMVASE